MSIDPVLQQSVRQHAARVDDALAQCGIIGQVVGGSITYNPNNRLFYATYRLSLDDAPDTARAELFLIAGAQGWRMDGPLTVRVVIGEVVAQSRSNLTAS